EAELFQVLQRILEIIAACAATAGGAEDHARRLVERQPAGVIRAAAQRSKRKGLHCAVRGLHLQQPPRIDQAAAHLALPYPIDRLFRQSKRCTTAGPTAVEPEG